MLLHYLRVIGSGEISQPRVISSAHLLRVSRRHPQPANERSQVHAPSSQGPNQMREQTLPLFRLSLREGVLRRLVEISFRHLPQVLGGPFVHGTVIELLVLQTIGSKYWDACPPPPVPPVLPPVKSFMNSCNVAGIIVPPIVRMFPFFRRTYPRPEVAFPCLAVASHSGARFPHLPCGFVRRHPAARFVF